MVNPNAAVADEFNRERVSQDAGSGSARNSPAHASAVTWGAILAGAAAAAAFSLILFILGTGLGLSSISPWTREGVSAAAFGVSSIVWVTVTQLLAAGMGGYLAGRLRTKWVEVHTDEVYFRDTAHGFLAWAIATLATAALLSSVIVSVVTSGVRAGGVATAATAGATAAAGSATAKSDGESGPMGYFVDSLFRKDANPAGATEQASAPPSAEVTRIFMNAGRSATLPPEDVRHVGQLVAQRTGMAPQDAEKRVSDTYVRIQAKLREAENAAREAADKARKASIHATLWLFVSLLMGAFVASLAATYGGRQRDA